MTVPLQGRNHGNGQTGQLPPEMFADMMAFTYSTRKVISRDLRYLYVNLFSRHFFAYVCAASYRIKLLTSQCTMLPKTPSKEPETSFKGASCEVKPSVS